MKDTGAARLWSRFWTDDDAIAPSTNERTFSHTLLFGEVIAAAPIRVPATDTTPPTLFSYGPALGSGARQPNTTFTLGFSEAVKAGPGNITITDIADNSVFQTITTSDTSRVLINNNAVTVDAAPDYLPGHIYNITFDAGSFTDLAGNPWSGALNPNFPLEFGIDPTIHVAGGTTYTVASGDHVTIDDSTNPSPLAGFILDAPAFSSSDTLIIAGTVDIVASSFRTVAGINGDVISSPISHVWNQSSAVFHVVGSNQGGGVSGLSGRDVSFTNDGIFDISGAGDVAGTSLSESSPTFRNTGTFSVEGGGVARGVWLSNGGTFVNTGDMTIRGHGTANGIYHSTFGLLIQSTFSINNSGMLTVTNPDGTSFGIEYTIGISAQQTIINSGTITADVAIEELRNSTTQGPNNTHVINSGTIDGALWLNMTPATDSVGGPGWTDGGAIVHTVDNTGTINGDIKFGAYNDTYNGGQGTLNGVIYGGGGSDTINAGAGHTAAGYSGAVWDYSVVFNASTQTFRIADNRSGAPDGVDFVHNVYELDFSSGRYFYDTQGRLTEKIETLTGGSVATYVYDLDDQHPWSELRTFVLADGTLEGQTLVSDNGAIWSNDYYALNPPGTAQLWTTSEVVDNKIAVSVTGETNGFLDLTISDVQNQYPWSSISVRFDSHGFLQLAFGENDDHTTNVSLDDLAPVWDTLLWFSTPYDMSTGDAPSEAPFTGGAGRDVFYGFGGNDTIDGKGGNDWLVGGIGNDTIAGGSGDDTFLFSFGDGLDTITDFTPGNASGDVISLRNYGIATFAQLQPFMSQQGADTLIAFDDQNHILLQNVALTDLNAGDFLFR